MTEFHRSKEWARFTRRARPILARTLPTPCVDPKPGCTGMVRADQQWDVAHLVAHALDPDQPLDLNLVGVAHRTCNRVNGAKIGRAKQLARIRAEQRLPTEGSGW